MKQYILDAYNIIYKDARLKSAMDRSPDIGARALIQRLVPFASRYKSYKIVVVFDGDASNLSTPYNNIRIISVGTGNTADEKIKNLVKELRSPAETTIISSDTEIHNFARINSAKTMSSEQFLSMLAGKTETGSTTSASYSSKGEKPGGVSKKEINRMKKAFDENDDIEIPEHFLKK